MEDEKTERNAAMVQWFTCGQGGKTGVDGLPEFIFVCPMPGLSGFAIYKKHADYSEPGY